MSRFIIVYNSTTGSTKALAEAVMEGAQSLDLDTQVIDAFDAKAEDLLAADAIGFGVPTFNYHPAKPIMRVLDDLSKHDAKGKIAVVFGSYGWSGQGVPAVAEKLREIGFKVLDPAIRVKYKPSENEIDGCRLLGKAVAMYVKNITMTENLNQ